MGTIIKALFGISIVMLAINLTYIAIKNKKFDNWGLWIFIVFVLIYLKAFPFTNYDGISYKGVLKEDLFFVILLYLAMLFGMFASYIYNYLIKTRKRKFDMGYLFAPVFISPIVFLPLYAAFLESGYSFDNLDSAGIMIFFVAFENGFFWKEFFDNKINNKK